MKNKKVIAKKKVSTVNRTKVFKPWNIKLSNLSLHGHCDVHVEFFQASYEKSEGKYCKEAQALLKHARLHKEYAPKHIDYKKELLPYDYEKGKQPVKVDYSIIVFPNMRLKKCKIIKEKGRYISDYEYELTRGDFRIVLCYKNYHETIKVYNDKIKSERKSTIKSILHPTQLRKVS